MNNINRDKSYIIIEKENIISHYFQALEKSIPDKYWNEYIKSLSENGISVENSFYHGKLNQHNFESVIGKLRKKIPEIVFSLYENITLLDLGVIGYAAISANTIGKGLEIFHKYNALTTSMYDTILKYLDLEIIISPHPFPGYYHDKDFCEEDCLAGMWRALMLLSGHCQHVHNVGIYFTAPEPEHADIIKQYFDCPVYYNASEAKISIPTHLLEQNISSSSSVMSELGLSICDLMLGAGHQQNDLVTITKRLLLCRNTEEFPMLEEAAAQLNLGPIQFAKRLYRLGTNYKKILYEVKMQLALNYLRTTYLSIKEISFLVGYNQPAQFSRAFKTSMVIHQVKSDKL